jgi:hypothetical protein
VDHLASVELAERSGGSTEHIDELVELGILTPQAKGSFRTADIQRVKPIETLERSGILLEDLGRPVGPAFLRLSRSAVHRAEGPLDEGLRRRLR